MLLGQLCSPDLIWAEQDNPQLGFYATAHLVEIALRQHLYPVTVYTNTILNVALFEIFLNSQRYIDG
jgi:hypothetical protein